MRNLIRYTIVFIAFLLHSLLMFAEEGIIDSLKQDLQNATAGDSISILNEISRAYWNVSLDSSTEHANKALELAIYHNDKKGTGDALNRLGNAEYLKTNYRKAIEYYNRSLELRRNIGDSPGIMGSCNNLYLAYNILGNRDSAIHHIEMALELSLDTNDEPEIAYYSNILGSIKSELHDFEAARVNIERAHEIYKNINDMQGIASTLNNMGSMYRRMSLYDKAQECYFEALQCYRETNDMSGVASAMNNIGIIHKRINNLDIALDYYNNSLEIYKETGGNRSGISSLLNNIGIIWHEKGDYDKALDYYTQALESYETAGNIQGIATASHNTGIVHTRLGNYEDALKSYMKSVNINKTIGSNFNLANNFNNLGELYFLQNDYYKALEVLEEALGMATSMNAKELISENYLFQSIIYREKEEYEKSLHFYELFDQYKDSIFTTDTGDQIAELQVRFQRESQMTELDFLEKDNYIQQLRIREQETLLLYLGGIALLTGIFVFVILGMYRYNKKLNLVLKEKTRELENACNELTDLENTLKKLNSTKDKFFSIIAHDLKNPFNALLGFSETLNQNYKDLSREQVFTYIDIIDKSAVNLYRLLENLLEWSKSQTGNMHYKPEKFNVKGIAETGIDTVRVNAERKNINISTRINPRLTAFADKNHISTVIRNLLNNAVKFTHRNGEIIISAKKTDRHVEISVADNGIGIAPGEQKKLFSLDHNITTVGTDDERGTGLGLLLCKEFVEKSGGRLYVESEPGKGSIFTFTLPLSFV
ncbi:MAG: tetratricopeptide repeat-containing sensor histidine kinase [Bacteroidales bacterium]